MDDQNCGNCRFIWDGGICRRYPESVGTSEERWCGEWQPKPVPTDQDDTEAA